MAGEEITSRRYQGETDGERLTQDQLGADDCIQARHDIGGTGDSDKGIPFKVIKSGYVAICTTAAATVDKVITVQNFKDFKLENGIEVAVYFKNGNTATAPTFNVNGTGVIAAGLENQAASVTIGAGCWGDGVWLTLKYQKVTIDGLTIEKWIIKGHDIAQQNNNANSGYTIYSDGRIRHRYTEVVTPSILGAGPWYHGYISKQAKQRLVSCILKNKWNTPASYWLQDDAVIRIAQYNDSSNFTVYYELEWYL